MQLLKPWGKSPHDSHWTENWVGNREGLDTGVVKTTVSAPLGIPAPVVE
jgi:hypothetical protein